MSDPILICFALRDEAAPFLQSLKNCHQEKISGYSAWRGRIGQTEVVVALTGIGLTAANRAVSDLLAALPCSHVISAGYAGALRADLKRGDMILPELVTNEADTYTCDGSLISDASTLHAPRCSRLISVSRIIVTSSEKRELHQRTGADAVDMESAATASVCRSKNIPFVVARIISDEVGDDLPVDFNVLLGKNQQPDPARAARYFLRHPNQLAATLKMRRQLNAHAKKLAQFLNDHLCRL